MAGTTPMPKVYCKVDADYASIEVGDLLTTSSTAGHAMKAEDPKLHRPVIRARCQGLSIRTPRNAVHIPSVPLQAGQQFARGGVPELHCLVTRARCQGLSIRTPRYGVHTASVSLQASQQFARGGIPKSNRPVTRTRGQGLSIRTPGYAADRVGMAR